MGSFSSTPRNGQSPPLATPSSPPSTPRHPQGPTEAPQTPPGTDRAPPDTPRDRQSPLSTSSHRQSPLSTPRHPQTLRETPRTPLTIPAPPDTPRAPSAPSDTVRHPRTPLSTPRVLSDTPGPLSAPSKFSQTPPKPPQALTAPPHGVQEARGPPSPKGAPALGHGAASPCNYRRLISDSGNKANEFQLGGAVRAGTTLCHPQLAPRCHWGCDTATPAGSERGQRPGRMGIAENPSGIASRERGSRAQRPCSSAL